MQDNVGQTQQTTLDTTSRRPGVSKDVVLLLVWCAIEATFCAFALRPTMSELVSDLAGFEVNPIVLVVPLAIFLTVLIAGSFACIQVLIDAIKAKHIANIVSMILTEAVVAMFQVIFLYRPLFDAMIPWLSQGGLTLGAGASFALASLAWVAVRGMTWYLLGRSGAPALAAVLNRYGGTRR